MLRSHNWVVVGLIGVMLLALTGTASADDDDDNRPGVVSWPAQGITSGGALLRGWVNPNDRATTYRFEYGTTSSYGTQTASASAGSSDDWRLVTAAVSALAPQTTYHYRVVATNSKGTAYGGDLTFTTTEVGAEPAPNDPGEPSGPGAGPPPSGDPQPGSTVAVTPGRGTVRVRVRGSSEFVPLAAGAGLPFGSEVDTTKGSISLTSVLPSGASQTGKFGGGRFVIRSGARGYIDLHLRGRFCSRPRAQRGSEASYASASASRPQRRSGAATVAAASVPTASTATPRCAARAGWSRTAATALSLG